VQEITSISIFLNFSTYLDKW